MPVIRWCGFLTVPGRSYPLGINPADEGCQANDDNVVITIRGIGQMTSRNPGSTMTLSGELDEYGMPRAFVQINPTDRDNNLWNAMDEAADDVSG